MRKTQGGRVLCRWRGLPPRCGKAIKLINLDNQRRNLRAAEWWPCPEESPWLDLARQSCRHSAPSIEHRGGGSKGAGRKRGGRRRGVGDGQKAAVQPGGSWISSFVLLSFPPSLSEAASLLESKVAIENRLWNLTA